MVPGKIDYIWKSWRKLANSYLLCDLKNGVYRFVSYEVIAICETEGVCVKQSPDPNQNRKSFIENSKARLRWCVETARCNRALLFLVRDFRQDITCKKLKHKLKKTLFIFFSAPVSVHLLK